MRLRTAVLYAAIVAIVAACGDASDGARSAATIAGPAMSRAAAQSLPIGEKLDDPALPGVDSTQSGYALASGRHVPHD